jgi:hypothetical protein
MDKHQRTHFLSVRDNLRFALFVGSASLLLMLGFMNKSKSVRNLPGGTQLIDSKPQSEIFPAAKSAFSQISEKSRA